MKGIILSECIDEFFTDLKDIFNAINDRQKEYNWLLTDYDCNHYPSSLIFPNRDFIWLDGEVLSKLVEENKIQFIWGVLSGFKKDVSSKEVLNYSLPFANGNSQLWDSKISIQHPLADVEIVLWDSRSLLLLSKDESIVDDFVKGYPNSLDLAEYNSGE